MPRINFVKFFMQRSITGKCFGALQELFKEHDLGGVKKYGKGFYEMLDSYKSDT